MLKANKCLRQLRSADRQSNKYLDIRLKELIENLKEYEVNARELIGCDFDDYIYEDVEPTKAEVVEADGHDWCGNSYNWCSDIVVNWFSYIINGKKYLAIKFHIAGDVRGNYTDTMLCNMTLDTFFEVLAESTRVYFSTSIGKYNVSFDTDALHEGNVFNIYVTDCDGNEVACEYDKYVSNIDTSERNRRELAKQIRALFRKDGELHGMIA